MARYLLSQPEFIHTDSHSFHRRRIYAICYVQHWLRFGSRLRCNPSRRPGNSTDSGLICYFSIPGIHHRFLRVWCLYSSSRRGALHYIFSAHSVRSQRAFEKTLLENITDLRCYVIDWSTHRNSVDTSTILVVGGLILCMYALSKS